MFICFTRMYLYPSHGLTISVNVFQCSTGFYSVFPVFTWLCTFPNYDGLCLLVFIINVFIGLCSSQLSTNCVILCPTLFTCVCMCSPGFCTNCNCLSSFSFTFVCRICLLLFSFVFQASRVSLYSHTTGFLWDTIGS